MTYVRFADGKGSVRACSAQECSIPLAMPTTSSTTRLECLKCHRVVHLNEPVADASKLVCVTCGARGPSVSVIERRVPFEVDYKPNEWRK